MKNMYVVLLLVGFVSITHGLIQDLTSNEFMTLKSEFEVVPFHSVTYYGGKGPTSADFKAAAPGVQGYVAEIDYDGMPQYHFSTNEHDVYNLVERLEPGARQSIKWYYLIRKAI